MVKERLSDEYVAMALMEHLVHRREGKEPSCTAHYLSKIGSIRTTQRQQRIERMLAFLCQKGYVKRTKSTAGTIYEITDEGYEWYKQYMRRAFDVLRELYK